LYRISCAEHAGKRGYSSGMATNYLLLHNRKGAKMENNTRVALIGIIVENMDAVDKLNNLLHEFNKYIIGRMGIPYRQKNISIISVVVDAEADIISTLSGKLGMIKGISVKTIYSKK